MGEVPFTEACLCLSSGACPAVAGGDRVSVPGPGGREGEEVVRGSSQEPVEMC